MTLLKIIFKLYSYIYTIIIHFSTIVFSNSTWLLFCLIPHIFEKNLSLKN